MSLKISQNQILVQRADGSVKFTSDNKLIYQKFFKSATITVASATVKESFQAMGEKDFLIISVNIVSSNGNVNGNTGIVGKAIPANGSLLIDVYGRAEGNSGACDIEYLGINVCGSDLVFNTIRFNADGVMSKGQKTTQLTYTAAIFSYL
jgi:hypothetical protein